MRSHPPIRCDGVSRRDFLHLGVLTALGVSLSDLLRLQGAEGPGAPRATSCILLWLDGGPSHLDTFDPKPEAPSEIRSPFGSIPTSVPGVRICEHLARTAKVMGDVALIRSLTHELGNHDTGARFLLTGHRPTPALQYPSLGSVVAHELRSDSAMPPYIAIPNDAVGGDSGGARAGYLPGAFSAFNVGDDPSRARDLNPPEGVSFSQADHRRDMLRRMDALSRAVEEGPATKSRDAFFEQAYRLMASSEARAAFDLERETAAVRERFGRTRLGAGCLMARRLVEAGARFVTVVDTGWDTHQQIARELPDSRFPGSGKLPSLDHAYSALLTDLRERGLLESTLVVLMGEFGRTPKLNALGGRDHWPRAGFVCLAGGGVKGGQVIGATNAFGETPSDRPISPPDLAFTILRLLGVDPAKELVTPGGRPVKVLAEGGFISGLV
ncbi:MAG: DUF1501 domain-containing protein [Verrucomicrobia bacterium]|nr:DUF1501 domain-containing protein [Verrucomicrobiota bacterium]MBI3869376.1 DUF1501 domain-containing protein [Verrucomicrobiota bacterium]